MWKLVRKDICQIPSTRQLGTFAKLRRQPEKITNTVISAYTGTTTLRRNRGLQRFQAPCYANWHSSCSTIATGIGTVVYRQPASADVRRLRYTACARIEQTTNNKETVIMSATIPAIPVIDQEAEALSLWFRRKAETMRSLPDEEALLQLARKWVDRLRNLDSDDN